MSKEKYRPQTEINNFNGKYSFLANNYPTKVRCQGQVFGSIESALRASKMENNARTLRDLLDQKFRDSYCLERLLATEKLSINDKSDDNILGKALMDLREDITNKNIVELTKLGYTVEEINSKGKLDLHKLLQYHQKFMKLLEVEESQEQSSIIVDPTKMTNQEVKELINENQS